MGALWSHLRDSDEALLCAAIHDELLVQVKNEPEVVEKWIGLLRNAMESAEAKWLGDIPAVADVKVGQTWQECH